MTTEILPYYLTIIFSILFYYVDVSIQLKALKKEILELKEELHELKEELHK